MSNEKKLENTNAEEWIVSGENLEAVSGGVCPGRYACVNPGCSSYMVYLPFPSPENKCMECGQQMMEIY